METKKRIEEHLNMICGEIGPRPTGSQANNEAVAYVYNELNKFGLNVIKQEFDCMDWKSHEGLLKANEVELIVMPAPYSLPCNVTGEVIYIHSIQELKEKTIEGKIVVLCDEIASEPLMPKGFVFWNPDEHKEIISLLENSKILAVLTVSLSLESYTPMIEDGDFMVPCGIILSRNLKQLEGCSKVNVRIDAKRIPIKAANVIATYGSGDLKVCISAHIDTKPSTPGALDNASGVSVLLALAEKVVGEKLPYKLEFVFFNGEDYYSNPGEMLYLNTYLNNPEEYICAYNIDGVGLKEKNTTYSFYECTEELSKSISSHAKELKFELIEPWLQGDHTLFSFSGVPAIAITSSSIFEMVDNVLHTNKDTLDLIDTEKLESLVNFLSSTI